MRTKNSTDIETTVNGDFVLKLPAAIDVKPSWSVPVSKNATAHIYEVKTQDKDKTTGVNIPGQFSEHYRVYIANNKTGVTPLILERNYGRYSDGFVATTAVEVATHLKNVARLLQPKKTKVVSVDETGGDD